MSGKRSQEALMLHMRMKLTDLLDSFPKDHFGSDPSTNGGRQTAFADQGGKLDWVLYPQAIGKV